MGSIYANLLEQKKAFAQEKSSSPIGLVWDTNIATVSLFWDTNMAAVTSCENTTFTLWRQVVVRHPGIDTREHPCDQHKIKIPTVASSVTISS